MNPSNRKAISAQASFHVWWGHCRGAAQTLARLLEQNPRWRRALLGLVGVWLAAGALGFVLLPWAVHGWLERQAGQALHRTVHLGAWHFNPYSLALTLERLQVDGLAGEAEPVLRIERVYANLEAASLLHGGPVLRELTIEQPQLALRRTADGRYSISDLLDEWLAGPSGPTPPFSLNNIRLSQGRVHFTDVDRRGQVIEHEVDAIGITLPFVSSLPYQTDIFTEPAFTARVDGAAFTLKGKTKPFAASHESALELALEDFDLARLLPYLPASLPVKLQGGRLSSELSLHFQQAATDGPSLQLSGRLSAHDLSLATRDGGSIALRELTVEAESFDPFQHRLLLRRLAVNGAQVRLQRAADGRLAGLGAGGAASAAPGANRRSADKPWQWQVDQLEIADSQLRLRDLSLPNPADSALGIHRLSLQHLDGSGRQTAQLKVEADINELGQLNASGSVRASPLAVDLDVSWARIGLLPWQPYFASRLNALLTSGQVSGKGHVAVSEADWRFDGETTVGNLAALDANRVDLLRWKSLYLGGVAVRGGPSMAVNIGEVALSDFQARADVAPDGKLNLAQLLKAPPVAGTETASKVANNAAPATVAADPAGPQVSIGKITLQGGRLTFTDRYIKPGYTARLADLGGRIGSFANSGGKADFDLRGKADGAPVRISGTTNPLTAPPFLDLKAEVRGFELTPLSAYAAKYAGYAISKGKLSLDVSYRLENNQLQANNRLFLDQLTFGERVESPSATKLPVLLAVSLLKNRNGEIDINLPISGSLDDPQFSVGGIVVQIILNLLAKAITSPFALIGALFDGNHEELSWLDYDAGRSALTVTAQKRLQAIAKALEARPALKLEITGMADPELDVEGLRHAMLERRVRQQKLAERARAGQESGENLTVSAEEYPRYLKLAYDAESFPKPRNLIGLAKSLPVDEMEKLMLANLAVKDDDLRQLAQRRAQAAREWLVEQGKVDAGRVFLLAPQVVKAGKENASGQRVTFSLR